MLKITCEKCNSVYHVKEEYAGKQVRCKKCGQVLRVEAPEENVMPDFDALFKSLAEEEQNAPTLEDSMAGA